ncbi:MAG: ATP-dependent DNA helicase, partial [Actinobacteria bacterium]|nr:ATP-dependent DNA helicase [Actinomycetota bacterium]
LYVGITRAREHLQLSFARARTAGGRGSRKPSRFLTGIWPVEEDVPTRPKRASNVKEELDPADEPLFEMLRQWRAEEATRLSRPAYTVLHDTTLVAIATAKPRDLRQLTLLRGIGATKMQSYGPQLLSVVGEWLESRRTQ